MEENGQAAKYGNQHKGNQRHLFDFTIAYPGIDQHDRGGDNQRGGCGVDIVKLVEGEEDYQR